MSTTRIQEKLRAVVDDGDSRLLKMLYAVAKEYTEENYTLPGKPMTERVLKTRIRSAQERIKSGRFTTQANLEKEMKTW
jgi:hypothetical protein